MIVRTPLSLSSAGLRVLRFSAMVPLIWRVTAEMLPEIWSSAELWLCSWIEQGVGVGDEADHLVAALGQHSGDLVGVGQQTAQLSVTLVESLGEAGHALHGDLHVGRSVFEGVRQHL